MNFFFWITKRKFELITKKLKRLFHFSNFINLWCLLRRHLPWLALASSLLLRPFPGGHSLNPNCPRCPSRLFEGLLLLPHHHHPHHSLLLLPPLCRHCCRPRYRMSWLAARQQGKDWHGCLTWGQCIWKGVRLYDGVYYVMEYCGYNAVIGGINIRHRM